jgi:hypothetical protein
MRRPLAILAAAGALVVPAAAHAGFDSPLHHEAHPAEIVIPGKHCSKIANPLECTHEGKSYPTPIRPSNPYSDKSCRWAHIMYDYHHPPGTGKPWMLEAYTGCRLFRADLRYHSALARAGVDDSLQERLESTALRAIPELISN